MPSWRWDQSKFDETLQRYAAVSSRTFAEIINTKLFYIARGAARNTPKADVYSIKQTLGGMVKANVMLKNGKMVKRRRLQLVSSAQSEAPLAALIVQARWAKNPEGGPGRGLYGKAMADAIKKLIGARMRSVAFLKSGWLPAIRTLAPLAKDKNGAAPLDSGARQFGRPKGEARPALPGFNPTGEIWNVASAQRDHKAALIQYGQPALMQAIAEEEASMLEYIEKKMKPDADAFNGAQG